MFSAISEQTALMQACQHGHWEVVLILILFKANVRLLLSSNLLCSLLKVVGLKDSMG